MTIAAAAAAALVLGLQSWWLLAPDHGTRLRDDAFYEFTWAANVAAGHGPTVSDGVTTSGVQLLWSLLLVPIAWLLGAEALPGLAPWFGFALHVAAAVLWWRSCRDRLVGWCVGACWLGNALLLRECQNGQETALACLFATLLWLARRSTELRFALLAVLAVAARSDLFGLVLALSVWRHPRALARALGAPGVALAAHVAANLLLGGAVWPDSALPMAWLWHANQAAADPAGERWLAAAWWYLRPALFGGPWSLASAMGLGLALFLVLRPRWPALLRAVPAVLVGVAAALGARDLAVVGWAALLLAALPAAGRRPVPWALVALLLGLGAIVVLHWAVRWYPRDYYVAPLVVAATAAVARVGRKRLLLLAFAVAQCYDLARVQPEPLAGQHELATAGRYLADVLPAGERVGCFNSGLVGFHAMVLAPPARRRAVVNLDGVVDARTFTALRAGRLSAWLDAEAVRFLLDAPGQFVLDPTRSHANGLWFGDGFDPDRDLIELARFVDPAARPGGDGVRLYWRRGRGEPPPAAPGPIDLGSDPDGAHYFAWPARAGETLQRETVAGGREPVVHSDAATLVVVRLAPGRRGTGRLFVDDRREPLLTLRPL